MRSSGRTCSTLTSMFDTRGLIEQQISLCVNNAAPFPLFSLLPWPHSPSFYALSPSLRSPFLPVFFLSILPFIISPISSISSLFLHRCTNPSLSLYRFSPHSSILRVDLCSSVLTLDAPLLISLSISIRPSSPSLDSDKDDWLEGRRRKDEKACEMERDQSMPEREPIHRVPLSHSPFLSSSLRKRRQNAVVPSFPINLSILLPSSSLSWKLLAVSNALFAIWTSTSSFPNVHAMFPWEFAGYMYFPKIVREFSRKGEG